MNKREKRMLIITIILFALLITKSLFLDEVKNLTEDELKFKGFVEKAVEENEKYNGFLKKMNLVNYKVVSIKKISDKGKSSVMYFDQNQNKYVQEEISGKYQAKVKGYFLHIFPYKQFRVESVFKK